MDCWRLLALDLSPIPDQEKTSINNFAPRQEAIEYRILSNHDFLDSVFPYFLVHPLVWNITKAGEICKSHPWSKIGLFGRHGPVRSWYLVHGNCGLDRCDQEHMVSYRSNSYQLKQQLPVCWRDKSFGSDGILLDSGFSEIFGTWRHFCNTKCITATYCRRASVAMANIRHRINFFKCTLHLCEGNNLTKAKSRPMAIR
ncbi:hypothetical protein BDV97DRAFT_195705 [Delphinella strobiligena]|nr:hypothetical protein BDV97DRAFT_195705 [Delphinella strobiligena]